MAGPAFQDRIVGRGLAIADFDGDGREDVAVANFAGPPLLLHNQGAAGNWVTLRLQGKPPNRAALGATVLLSCGGQQQIRTIQTGRSYLSAFPAEAHFGIGTATEASAKIRWPNGSVQQLPHLRTNAVNVIRQR